MADFQNRQSATWSDVRTTDAGLRNYMIRTYNYMASGLALTGIFAFMTYMAAVQETANGIQLTQFGNVVFNSPLRWVIILAPLAMVFFLSFRINRMSVQTAQMTFWTYASTVGVSLASIGLLYSGESIGRVFFITAASFSALSFYGYTTKKDLTAMGSFLFMGLIGVFLAMLVNLFLASTALQFVISVIGVLVFAGLTAYDTQVIKNIYYEGDSEVVEGRKSIIGALRLYLDFLNMFLFLLHLFGNRE